ncbi:MAG TPA: formate dehydrogenase accessory protein FdhE [Desulfonatronum sp.]|nr:formate dehydrogenase accessory protein FdhE [Desulfonatronum sp.]
MERMEKDRQKFIKKLDVLRAKDTFPQSLLDLLERVGTRQFQAIQEYDFSQVAIPDIVSQDRHAQGASLLPRAQFPVFLPQSGALFQGILEDVQPIGGDLGAGAEQVEDELKSGALNLESLFQAYLAEDKDVFEAWAKKTPGAPRLMFFLVQSSLAPFLEGLAHRIQESTPAQNLWEHGHCPVCGSLPFISRLENKEGLRKMFCSFCRSDYRVPRLGCVFCGEKDFKKLRYFEAEQEPGFRVDLCDQCKMCIKTVDFRNMDRVSVPVLDDLESLTLDVLAQSKGFVRPTLSAWGF